MATVMSTETASSTLLTLPGEIQNTIVGMLEPLDRLLFRSTCRHFRSIIPPLGLRDLLLAEWSKTGWERDLFACSFCLRLRHASHFADNMLKKTKRGLPGGGINRFCLDCGLNPPPGRKGYNPGDFITRKGLVSVLCISCTRLRHPSRRKDGENTQYCAGCWSQTPEGKEMQPLGEE